MFRSLSAPGRHVSGRVARDSPTRFVAITKKWRAHTFSPHHFDIIYLLHIAFLLTDCSFVILSTIMTSTTMETASTLTPPRGKAHRITPHHNNKSHFATHNYEHKAHLNENKRRNSQPPAPHNATKKTNHERSHKRQNVNPTPQKPEKGTAKKHLQKGRTSDPPEPLMDASNPEHAHRIKQRQKMLTKGKNTAGYARYRATVPLEKRQARSMTTPATPNPYLQISTKRWQGLVRAW